MEDDSHTEDELSGSLHDLLRTITSPTTTQPSAAPAWSTRGSLSEAAASSSRTSLPLSTTATANSNRSTPIPNLLQQRRTLSPQQDSLSAVSEPLAYTNQLSPPPPPPRSIFVSGPPTSSVSANTAHASLSTTSASGGSLPIHALTSTGLSRRVAQRPIDLAVSTPTIPGLGVEKGVDDFGQANDSGDNDATGTSHKLSGLFATESDTPGILSRETTQLRTYAAIKSPPPDASTLAGHLLYNGFLNGRHSDITVHAFGQSYKLHKLILDRAPYFSMAFSGPWTESLAQEMTIIPEEIDANITQRAFELALKRLYGTAIATHEEQEAIGLFATACWLDMPDLVDTCVDYILRQMNTSNLHNLIKLVTNSYYGRPGDRVLASAKAMLCREGWEMPYEHWNEIPAEIIREVIGGDPFYVPGEWERWFLSLKILNRRLRKMATVAKLVGDDGRYLRPKPQTLRFYAVRFDSTYRRDSGFGPQKQWPEGDDAWCSLYTSPEVSPLLVLLDEGIHYVHLRFEQLQHIRSARDILGVPVLPEKIVSDALWMQMELRQRIMSAHDSDLELGLSDAAEEQEATEPIEEPSEAARGKQKADQPSVSNTSLTTNMESGSWDGNGQPRKFWIPTADVSCIIGGVREAIASPAMTSSGDWTAGAARLSASLEPSDVTWAVDFAGSMFDSGTANRPISSSSPPRFSHYPPFRFSTEFPNPRTLKERKRVYSQTVWYAGSMWNLYIQRVNTSKGQQLGIYLHRAKDKDPSDDPLAQFIPASVDDRMGQLEREILLRKTNNRLNSWHDSLDHNDDHQNHHHASSTRPQEFDNNTSTLLSPSRSASYHETPDRSHKTSQNPTTRTSAGGGDGPGGGTYHHRRLQSSSLDNPASQQPSSIIPDPDSPDIDASLLRANQRLMSSISTMPPYTDARSTIKTYFKIYSPSKAGRLLSVYESAPDNFNFGKSWGWKSSQMVLDDGIGGYESAGGGGGGKGTPMSVGGLASGGLSGKEGKLRYMVVIGNV